MFSHFENVQLHRTSYDTHEEQNFMKFEKQKRTMDLRANFRKIFEKNYAIGWPSIEYTLLKQCGCVKPWGGWRDFQIQLSLRTHRLPDLKSG